MNYKSLYKFQLWIENLVKQLQYYLYLKNIFKLGVLERELITKIKKNTVRNFLEKEEKLFISS